MERIKLDLIPGKKMPSLHASQYDDGREHGIDLFENGIAYKLDGTETLTINERKVDNNICSMDIENTFSDSNHIVFASTEQMCAVWGNNICELVIAKGEKTIGTLNFILEVEPSPTEGGNESESEIKNLNRQIDEHIDEVLPEQIAEAVPPIVEQVVGENYYSKLQSDELFATNEELEIVKNALGDISSLQPGKNKANSSNFVVGAIQPDGSIATNGAWSGYDTTDYIELVANTDYTFTNYSKTTGVRMTSRRLLLFYDSSKTPISVSYINDVSGSTTFNSGSYKYVRVAASNTSKFQLEKGSTYSDYTDYNESTVISALLGNVPTAQVQNMIEDAIIDRNKTITVNNGLVKVSTSFGTGTLERDYYLNGSLNHGFRFGDARYNGTKIKNSTDDITPQRVRVNSNDSATIGANHGWDYGYKAPVGSFTIADVGSIWSDGTTEYTLCSLNNGNVIFVPPVSKSDGVIQVSRIAPVANLHHVSGATHTSDVNISDITTTQLYPSTNNVKVELFIDEKKIIGDGAYVGSKVTFKESYGVVDLYELVEYVRSNVGDVDYDEIQSLFTMFYVYEISEDSDIVYSTLIADEYVYLVNCGFMQSEVMTAIQGGTIYRYVNGVASGTFESESLVDMSYYSTTNYINSGMETENQVPNRSVDVCKDNQGNILCGFVFGFVPDVGDGSDDKRALNSRFWDMRNNKKSYPYCIENEELEIGEHINVVGYRCYLPEMNGSTDKFSISVGNTKYFVVDNHRAVSGNFGDDDCGTELTVISNQNIKISDHVGSDGVTYYSLDNYSCAVARTSDISQQVANVYGYSKSKVDDLLDDKADKSNTYTQEQVNNIVSDAIYNILPSELTPTGAIANFSTTLEMPLVYSVDNSATKVIRCGVNLWDEETEHGYLSSSDGSFVSHANSICSKNYRLINPTAQVYVATSTDKTLYIVWFDENKNFISRKDVKNNVATSPLNARYFKLSCYNYGANYNNDISANCPADYTEYQAFSETEYPISDHAELPNINAVSGVNNMYADYGDISVEYKVSVEQYVSNHSGGGLGGGLLGGGLGGAKSGGSEEEPTEESEDTEKTKEIDEPKEEIKTIGEKKIGGE